MPAAIGWLNTTMDAMNVTTYYYMCHTQEFWLMMSKSIPNKEVVVVQLTIYNLLYM